jgi:hypothetical protein
VALASQSEYGCGTVSVAVMINFLAGLFRGLSFIFGISAPPPEEDQRRFVLMWLGIVAVLLGFAALLFYAISHLHIR